MGTPSSTMEEPKFQDTEVTLYSFFNDGSEDDAERNNKQQQQSKPPPMSKVLSILVPETKLLLLALGALTVSTAATMQFPNAIGQMIDILSLPVVDAGAAAIDASIDTHQTAIAISDGVEANAAAMDANTPQRIEAEMQEIGLRMAAFFSVGAVATFGHSALFDSIGQKIGAGLRKKLFTKLINEEVAFYDENRAGELANRLSTDVHEVAEHLVQNIAFFLSNFVRAITAVAQMIVISPARQVFAGMNR